jgi:predicted  nucleic acid-binding Zn-ribbon protein
LEEVSYLSMRNSQLEEMTTSVPQLQQNLEASTKKLEMLLVLLGEKEEELEAMMADMKEVKNMYRSHMEDLMDKINPPSPGGKESSETIVNA